MSLFNNLLSSSKRSPGGYRQVSADDEEGQLKLETTPELDTYAEDERNGNLEDSAHQGLLGDSSREKPVVIRKGGLRNLHLCSCCGFRVTCAKLTVILVIGLLAFLGYQALYYSGTPEEAPSTPTPSNPLEEMPEWGKSLGCSAEEAPYVFGSEKAIYTVPIGKGHDHFLNVRGGSVGTITIAPGFDDDESESVSIELTLRTSDRSLLDMVVVDQHDPVQEINSFWRLSTPYPGAAAESAEEDEKHSENPGKKADCIRFDIILRIPPKLRKLHVAAHALAHIRFADGVAVNSSAPVIVPKPNVNMTAPPTPLRTLDDVFVTLYSPRKDNILLSNTAIAADRMNLEMIGGWLVGSVGVREHTRVMTQRGGAHAVFSAVTLPYERPVKPAPESESSESTSDKAVDLHPHNRRAPAPEPAIFRAITGVGSSQIWLLNPAKRTLEVDNMSTGNGNVIMHYNHAGFRGAVSLHAHSFEAINVMGLPHNVQKHTDPTTISYDPEVHEGWVADKNGPDKLIASSRRGYMKLHF